MSCCPHIANWLFDGQLTNGMTCLRAVAHPLSANRQLVSPIRSPEFCPSCPSCPSAPHIATDRAPHRYMRRLRTVSPQASRPNVGLKCGVANQVRCSKLTVDNTSNSTATRACNPSSRARITTNRTGTKSHPLDDNGIRRALPRNNASYETLFL
jgi:hypothetical protein